MAAKSYLISVVIFLHFFKSMWVFADDAGLNSTDTFNESTSLGTPSNEEQNPILNNQEPAFQLGQEGMVQGDIPGMEGGMLGSMQGDMNPVNPLPPADQPQQDQEDVPAPTRLPSDPSRVSTFPPLVHNDGSSEKPKGDDSSTKAPSSENSKSDNSKGENGSGFIYGSLIVILSGVCALHLLN